MNIERFTFKMLIFVEKQAKTISALKKSDLNWWQIQLIEGVHEKSIK